jgi:hypothetical protein
MAGASGGSDGVDTSDVAELTTSLDPKRQLTSLSDAELAALCSRAHTHFIREAPLAKFERAICYAMSGAGAAATNGECKDLVDSCLTTLTFDYLACSLDVIKGEDSCLAKVEDYTNCQTERAAIAKAEVEYWDCDRPMDAEPPSQLSADPTGCFKLWSGCSELDLPIP